jgi:cytochrome c-type biogenesis protein CcmF
MIVDVSRNGRHVTTMYPSRRFYKASQQGQSMVAIRTTPLEDLYLVYRGDDPTTHQPVLQAYLNPLTVWIWIGAVVVIFGIVLALLPGRRADRSAPEAQPPLRVAEKEAALAQ